MFYTYSAHCILLLGAGFKPVSFKRLGILRPFYALVVCVLVAADVHQRGSTLFFLLVWTKKIHLIALSRHAKIGNEVA